LVGCLPSEQPVYAIDDDALTGGAPFGLASIEEAAEQSRELLCKALGSARGGSSAGGGGDAGGGSGAGGGGDAGGGDGGGNGGGEGGVRSIVLAGWSYGGVVAVQLAAALEATPAAGLRARSVVMFDAPLGQSVARGFHREGGVDVAAGSDDDTVAAKLRRLPTPAGAAGSSTLTAAADADDDALARLAAQHFALCNALLDRYAPGRVRVCCPLMDVRPRNSECVFLDSLDHLTSAAVLERVVAGDHWTMLFGENTEGAAAELSAFLKTA
jgi:thioesterase domain-containing protein